MNPLYWIAYALIGVGLAIGALMLMGGGGIAIDHPRFERAKHQAYLVAAMLLGGGVAILIVLELGASWPLLAAYADELGSVR